MRGSDFFDVAERRWYAIRVKFKAEKLVADQLQLDGIEAYVPVVNRQRLVRGKVRHTKIPLIHNYVFVYIKREEYIPVLQTLYVIGFVNIGGVISAIPDGEIDLMRRIVGSGFNVELRQGLHLVKGQAVQLIAGELTGLRGQIVEQSNGSSFIVELENIGMHLRIAVDASQVLPLTVAV